MVDLVVKKILSVFHKNVWICKICDRKRILTYVFWNNIKIFFEKKKKKKKNEFNIAKVEAVYFKTSLGKLFYDYTFSQSYNLKYR